jgi:hypothetical protein
VVGRRCRARVYGVNGREGKKMGRDEVQGWMDGFRVFGFVRTLMGAGQGRVTCWLCPCPCPCKRKRAVITHRLSARATNLVNISPPPLFVHPLQSLSSTKKLHPLQPRRGISLSAPISFLCQSLLKPSPSTPASASHLNQRLIRPFGGLMSTTGGKDGC